MNAPIRSLTMLYLTGTGVLAGADEIPAPAVPGEGALRSAGLIYPLDDKPTPQCHASTMSKRRDGLVAAWFGGSMRRIRTWESGWRGTMGEDGRKPARWPAGGRERRKSMRAGIRFSSNRRRAPLLLFYKVGPSPSRWWGVMTSSPDGGKTWQDRHKLGEDEKIGHLLGPVKNKPIQLDDGTILCGSSSEHDGWRVHFEVTKDFGKTWEVIGPIHDGKEFGAIQPSILSHRDGRMQVLCRSRQKVVAQSWSKDGERHGAR